MKMMDHSRRYNFGRIDALIYQACQNSWTCPESKRSRKFLLLRNPRMFSLSGKFQNFFFQQLIRSRNYIYGISSKIYSKEIVSINTRWFKPSPTKSQIFKSAEGTMRKTDKKSSKRKQFFNYSIAPPSNHHRETMALVSKNKL